jgi:hypothetical protein
MKLQVKGEVVKVVEVEASDPPADGFDALRFRIELIAEYEHPNVVKAVLWRREYYRVRPTFPQQEGEPSGQESDEIMFVEETSLIGEERFAANNGYAAVIEAVLQRINFKLGL